MTRDKAKEMYDPIKHVCITRFKYGSDRIWTVEHKPKFDSSRLQYEFVNRDSIRRLEQ